MSASDVLAAATASAHTCGTTRIITVDGPAGSGKTTFASELYAVIADSGIRCAVVHMDDLYESWDEDLIHNFGHKLRDWIITPLLHGLAPRYQRFDWTLNKYVEWVEIPQVDFLILEGVGSGSSVIRPFMSCSVWVESDVELRLDRVISRDGELVREHMKNWQLREAEYFAEQDVKSHATFQFRGQ